MKFKFKNLGLLDEAEVDLADLTIICGENNTGKTYAAYAIYGFLRNWSDISSEIIRDKFSEEIKSNAKQFDLNKIFSGGMNDFLLEMCTKYKEQLHKTFAAKSNTFQDCEITLSVNKKIDFYKQSNLRSMSYGNVQLTLAKESGSSILELLFSGDNFEESTILPELLIEAIIGDFINDTFLAPEFSRVHISSVERTGAAIFRKELDFARTRILKVVNEAGLKVKNRLELLKKINPDYAWPVEDNVDFTRRLEDIERQTSELSAKHPRILDAFNKVIGGTYKVDKNTGLYFHPEGGRKQRFTMNEASSSVRALVDVGFYLRGKAKPGDLFIIDEPELSLHPKNQRAFARLIARLVNAGIKVLITTHSDYIIKEFNTLIMLNQKTEHTRKIQKEHEYDDAELLDFTRVRLYMSGKLATEEGKPPKNTLTPAKIDPRYGIEVETFDDTIDTMNNIQEEILYGGPF